VKNLKKTTKSVGLVWSGITIFVFMVYGLPAIIWPSEVLWYHFFLQQLELWIGLCSLIFVIPEIFLNLLVRKYAPIVEGNVGIRNRMEEIVRLDFGRLFLGGVLGAFLIFRIIVWSGVPLIPDPGMFCLSFFVAIFSGLGWVYVNRHTRFWIVSSIMVSILIVFYGMVPKLDPVEFTTSLSLMLLVCYFFTPLISVLVSYPLLVLVDRTIARRKEKMMEVIEKTST